MKQFANSQKLSDIQEAFIESSTPDEKMEIALLLLPEEERDEARKRWLNKRNELQKKN